MTKAKDIKDLIKKTSPELYDEVMEGLKKRSFSRMLARMRVQAGMTQADMALALGVSQASISRLETADNDCISIQQLLSYGRVTGFGVMQGDPPNADEVVLKFSFV